MLANMKPNYVLLAHMALPRFEDSTSRSTLLILALQTILYVQLAWRFNLDLQQYCSPDECNRTVGRDQLLLRVGKRLSGLRTNNSANLGMRRRTGGRDSAEEDISPTASRAVLLMELSMLVSI